MKEYVRVNVYIMFSWPKHKFEVNSQFYTQYPLVSRLSGPQSHYKHCGEEKILDCTGTQALMSWSVSL